MSFSIFVGWVLAGLLAGLVARVVVKQGGDGLKTDIYLALAGSIGGSWLLRMVGLAPGSVFGAAVVAFIFAGVLIGVQRRFRPVEPTREERVALWRWGLGAAIVASILWMTLSPGVPPAATAAAVQDKTYAVTPPTLKVQTGIVAVELTDMKVTERVEEGSGTIKLEDKRTEPTIKFAASSSDRLDPGQEATESLEVDFPASALTGSLKTIHVDLVYIPSAYRQASARFGVAVGAK